MWRPRWDVINLSSWLLHGKLELSIRVGFGCVLVTSTKMRLGCLRKTAIDAQNLQGSCSRVWHFGVMLYFIAEYVDYLVILVGFTCTMKFLPLTVNWTKDFNVSCSQILLNQHPILVHLCGEDLMDNLHCKATLEMNEVYMDVSNDFIDNDQVNSLRSSSVNKRFIWRQLQVSASSI